VGLLGWNCSGIQGSLNSITGVGTVVGQPDVATFTFYITQSGNDTNSVLQSFRQMVNASLNELFNSGIPQEDIETSAFSIYPNYGFAEGKAMQAGIYIYEYFTVTVRDIWHRANQTQGQGIQNQTANQTQNQLNQTANQTQNQSNQSAQRVQGQRVSAVAPGQN
jgi:uncharacterized protein YggE